MNLTNLTLGVISLSAKQDNIYRSTFICNIQLNDSDFFKLRRLADSTIFFNRAQENFLVVTYYHSNKASKLGEVEELITKVIKDIRYSVELMSKIPTELNYTLQ